LHARNHVSARQLVRVLRFMHQQPAFHPEYLTSFAVAGRSGTLEGRMEHTAAAQVLRAKTGTLNSACGLSGYVTTKSGDVLAFALLVNDYRTRIQDVWAAQDSLGAKLAALDLTSSAQKAP
jgi:D-alanyl-D-alanine carboxypeptidase/D-alanyl-D-alanine-endopeptidase (penicillin-binding protein 4)